MGLITNIVARLSVKQTGSQDFGGPTFNPLMEYLAELSDGVAANQADMSYFDERSIGASSNDDIDLAGVLTNAFGAIMTMAELVALFIINRPKGVGASPNVSNLTVGVGSNPFLGFLGGTTPTFGPIRPGGFLFLACGDAAGYGTITASTADILRVANGSGGAAVYQIGIVARSQ